MIVHCELCEHCDRSIDSRIKDKSTMRCTEKGAFNVICYCFIACELDIVSASCLVSVNVKDFF